MNTLFIGKNFIHLEEVDSTNTFASALLSEGIPEGTLITADRQNKGRGQRASTWHSQNEKNLTLSVVLYPKFLQPAHAFDLNRAVSLSVWETVSHFLPEQEVAIKWPNDILVNRHKIAGILIENQLEAQSVKSSVVGIGLNIAQTDFPEGFKRQATSLALHSDPCPGLISVRDHLLQRLEAQYLQLRAGRRAQLDDQYLHALYAYQEDHPFLIEGQPTIGRIIGVERSGRLALQIGSKLQYFGLKDLEFST